MKIAWLQNNPFKNFSSLIETLEDVGYDSVLLTYSSTEPDNFVMAINHLNNSTIKYNIAVRPPTISPEYLAMMIQAVQEIHPGRLMINFVSGDLYSNENLNGIIYHDLILLSDKSYRRKYLSIFLDKLFDRTVLKNIPEMMIGSSSEDAIAACKKHGLMLALTYESFLDKKDILLANNINDVVINLPVILRPSVEEAKKAQSNILGPGDFGPKFLVGNYQTLIEKISELSGYNIVSQIMLSCVENDNDDLENHSQIKKALEALDV